MQLAAFLSSWLSSRQAVQEHAKAMGRPQLHEPDCEEVERARTNLQHIGVTVDFDGKIELSNEAKHIMKQAAWIVKDEEEASNPAEQVHGPAQRTLSRIMRNIAKIEAAERWIHSNEKEKERRPEAGGPGTGGTWSAPPDGTVMPNAHWRAATQARIGCINIPQNIKSRLKTHGGSRSDLTAQSKPRWEDFCATLVHTLTSREQFPNSSRGMDKGARKQYLTQRSDGPRPSTQQLLTSPFVVRMPHVMEAASRLQVQTTLGGLLRNTGAHVDLERAIPELFTWHGQRCTEAILDAAIRWPTSLHTTVVDITVRCPHASRYGGGVTASSPNHAGRTSAQHWCTR